MSATSGVRDLPTVSNAAPRRPAGLSEFQSLARQIWAGVGWALQGIRIQPRHKGLRLCESLPLGDKRFVVVVQVEGERFLIGSAPGSVSLLTRLQQPGEFGESLQRKLEEGAAR